VGLCGVYKQAGQKRGSERRVRSAAFAALCIAQCALCCEKWAAWRQHQSRAVSAPLGVARGTACCAAHSTGHRAGSSATQKWPRTASCSLQGCAQVASFGLKRQPIATRDLLARTLRRARMAAEWALSRGTCLAELSEGATHWRLFLTRERIHQWRHQSRGPPIRR